MAKFLKNHGISEEIENLIRNANRKLVLISPYWQLSDSIKRTLQGKVRDGLSVQAVYRAADAELSRIEQGHLRENGFIRSVEFDAAPDNRPASRDSTEPESPYGSDDRTPVKATLTTEAKPQADSSGTKPNAELPADVPQSNSTKSTSDTSTTRSVSPEIDAARQWVETHGDTVLPFMDDDGTERQARLRDLLAEVDNDLADLDNVDAATQAAINCFLKFGDHA